MLYLLLARPAPDVEVGHREKQELCGRSLTEHIVASLNEMEYGGDGACEAVAKTNATGKIVVLVRSQIDLKTTEG
jgi:hypothetical protein